MLFYFEKILLIMPTNEAVSAVGVFERFSVRLGNEAVRFKAYKIEGDVMGPYLFNGMFQYH